jgi:mannosyltransferase
MVAPLPDSVADNLAGSQVAVEASGEVTAEPAAASVAAGRDARSAWLPLLPAAVTAVVVAIGLSVPSYWRDEAATVAAVHRPLGALMRMLGNVDAVHGTYYLLIWPVAQLFGTGDVALRIPSLLGMAVAAGLITAIGRRVASPTVGLLSGLIFAVSPTVSEFGQMARSYAILTMAAALATYALVRVLEQDASRVRWLWYAFSLTLLGALNIFALLLIPAHAITMLLRYRARSAGGGRAAWRRWLIAAGVALVINLPLIDLASHQRGQIQWVPAFSPSEIGNAADLLGPPWMTAGLAILVLAAGGLALARRRSGNGGAAARGVDQPRSTGWGAVCGLCLPWLVVPPLVLMLGTVVYTPVYTQRYVLFCLPAAALMTAVAIAELAKVPGRRVTGWAVAATAVVVVAALGFTLQVQYRQPWGHADDIRDADSIIAATARPGDVLAYRWPVFMPISAAYPGGLGRLPDIQVGRAAIPSGTLAGTPASLALMQKRIRHARRFWLVQVSGMTPEPKLLDGLHMRMVWTWQVSDMWLELYVHDGARSGPGPLR